MIGESYVFLSDPFPVTDPEHSRVADFYAALAEGRLTTLRCTQCGHTNWPPQVACRDCNSDAVEWIDLPTEGTVHGFTIQAGGLPRGFQAPAIFALVDVAGLRIFTTIVDCPPDRVEIGMPVRLKVTTVPGTAPGETRPRHTFAPA